MILQHLLDTSIIDLMFFLKMLFSANVNLLEKSQITFGEKSLLQEVLFMSTGLHMSKMPLYMVKCPIMK